jgi:hypothetical protein
MLILIGVLPGDRATAAQKPEPTADVRKTRQATTRRLSITSKVVYLEKTLRHLGRALTIVHHRRRVAGYHHVLHTRD